ncbi:MAG: DUF1868 domain-containing protein [Alphaproteobacteria bacterium]|nr:DUF1868 domain-containing protein [Alphaproteobacteria bacterium]
MAVDPIDIAGDGSARFPPAVGSKYYPDGEVRRFPGNTVVCPVPPGGSDMAALIGLRARLRDLAESRAFAFTPPESYHMTLFEGVNEQERVPDIWTRHHGLDAPLDLITSDFCRRLRDLSVPDRIEMRPTGLRKSPRGGFLVELEEAPGGRLRAVRDVLSDRLGIRKPRHDDYRFHITLSYQIHWLPPAAAGPLSAALDDAFLAFREQCPMVTLGPPAFCTFEDMHWFEPILDLVAGRGP